MEKLLSTTKKQGGKYATNLNRPTHKKYFLSYRGHENIFLPTPQQTTKKSTLFRMIYLSQPITGLLTKTSQLFSGRVTICCICCTAVRDLTNKAQQQNIISTALTLLSDSSD